MAKAPNPTPATTPAPTPTPAPAPAPWLASVVTYLATDALLADLSKGQPLFGLTKDLLTSTEPPIPQEAAPQPVPASAYEASGVDPEQNPEPAAAWAVAYQTAHQTYWTSIQAALTAFQTAIGTMASAQVTFDSAKINALATRDFTVQTNTQTYLKAALTSRSDSSSQGTIPEKQELIFKLWGIDPQKYPTLAADWYLGYEKAEAEYQTALSTAQVSLTTAEGVFDTAWATYQTAVMQALAQLDVAVSDATLSYQKALHGGDSAA